MPDKNLQIGVIGAGSWGTALAHLLATRGHDVIAWHRDRSVSEAINREHHNPKYLKDVILPENLKGTSDLVAATLGKEMLVTVVPSHAVREVVAAAARNIGTETVIISASKGIEQESLLTMNGVLRAVLPRAIWPNLAFLGGPSFAREVAMKLPTAVSIAADEPDVAKKAQLAFASPYMRAYTTNDVIGVELGGAMKNVLAIGAGIAEGLKFGHNTRAALITRGLAEMSRLGLKMGANPLTFAGLGGLGDLILTCTGDLSRNRKVGLALGEGKSLKEVLGSMDQVAEGVKTAKSLEDLSRKVGIEMPICHEVYCVLYENKNARQAVVDLMSRDLKDELE